jgi:hypothetical protein
MYRYVAEPPVFRAREAAGAHYRRRDRQNRGESVETSHK